MMRIVENGAEQAIDLSDADLPSSATHGDRAMARRGERVARGIPRSAVIFVAAHVILAAALTRFAPVLLSTAHAMASLLVGLYLTIKAPRTWALPAAGYIVGSELLWRMSGSVVPWEYGKYASSFVLFLGLVQLGRGMRLRWLPVAYLLLLLPAILVLADDGSLSGVDIFEMLSFNLSGPLSLAMSVWFCSHLDLGPEDEERLLIAMLAPLVGVGIFTLIGTVTATEIQFGQESNFATSGGFGPNQVSTALGLGAFVACVLFLRTRRGAPAVWVSMALMLFLAAQCALTLSRGGLYGFALAAMATVGTAFLRDRRARYRIVLMAVPALVAAAIVVVPRLDAFTGGALVARFEDKEPSGRIDIMEEDLRLWNENPVLGTGPGGAKRLRNTRSAMSHTEYTRLPAEHGAFGILALLLVVGMTGLVVVRALGPIDGALNMGWLVWSLVSMGHAGMRLGAMGILFGFAHARFRSWRVDRHG